MSDILEIFVKAADGPGALRISGVFGVESGLGSGWRAVLGLFGEPDKPAGRRWAEENRVDGWRQGAAVAILPWRMSGNVRKLAKVAEPSATFVNFAIPSYQAEALAKPSPCSTATPGRVGFDDVEMLPEIAAAARKKSIDWWPSWGFGDFGGGGSRGGEDMPARLPARRS